MGYSEFNVLYSSFDCFREQTILTQTNKKYTVKLYVRMNQKQLDIY